MAKHKGEAGRGGYNFPIGGGGGQLHLNSPMNDMQLALNRISEF